MYNYHICQITEFAFPVIERENLFAFFDEGLELGLNYVNTALHSFLLPTHVVVVYHVTIVAIGQGLLKKILAFWY